MKSDSKRLDAIDLDVSRQASSPEDADQQTTLEIQNAKQEAGLKPTEKTTLHQQRLIRQLERERSKLQDRLIRLEGEKDEIQNSCRKLEVSNARLTEQAASRADYDLVGGVGVLFGAVIMGGYQIAQPKDQTWIFAIGATLNAMGWLVSSVPPIRRLIIAIIRKCSGRRNKKTQQESTIESQTPSQN